MTETEEFSPMLSLENTVKQATTSDQDRVDEFQKFVTQPQILTGAQLHEMFDVLIGITRRSDPPLLFKPRSVIEPYMYIDQKVFTTPSEADKHFIENKASYQSKTFYGMHDYGGYWGFFRPSLDEVVALAYPWWVSEGKPQRVYVQTRPWPDDGLVTLCYDSELDKHRGQTTVWWQQMKQ